MRGCVRSPRASSSRLPLRTTPTCGRRPGRLCWTSPRRSLAHRRRHASRSGQLLAWAPQAQMQSHAHCTTELACTIGSASPAWPVYGGAATTVRRLAAPCSGHVARPAAGPVGAKAPLQRCQACSARRRAVSRWAACAGLASMRLDMRTVRAAAPQSGRAAQGAEALCYALLRHVRSACAAADNVWLAARLVAALAPAAQWLARAPELAQCTAYMLLRCARARARAAAKAAPCMSVLGACLRGAIVCM